MDRKRHLEAGGTSGILSRILIREVNNKVWRQGQSRATLILEKSNVVQVRSFGKLHLFLEKMLDQTARGQAGVKGRIRISAESTRV